MKSSRKIITTLSLFFLFLSIIAYSGCDEDKAWETADSSTGQTIMTLVIADQLRTFTVGGTVISLGGAGLVLQNNGGDDLPISASGTFRFNTTLGRNSTYNVTVSVNPIGQTCTPSYGTGTIINNDIIDVIITCVPPP